MKTNYVDYIARVALSMLARAFFCAWGWQILSRFIAIPDIRFLDMLALVVMVDLFGAAVATTIRGFGEAFKT